MKCVGFVPGLNFRRPSHLTTAYVRKQYRSVDIHRLRLAESGVSADGTVRVFVCGFSFLLLYVYGGKGFWGVGFFC